MTFKKTVTDYWFTIEPYVHVGLTNQCALLYNTLDGETIECDRPEVIELLREMLRKENCGVVLLTDKKYQDKNIEAFIEELRQKYMGDLIRVDLSKGKPVQVVPYPNFANPDKYKIYKKQNFSSENIKVLENLCEICIHVDHTVEVDQLIPFLQSVPEEITLKFIGNMEKVTRYKELLSFLDQHAWPKYIVCAYTDMIALQPAFGNNFFYTLSVDFPVDMKQWNHSLEWLLTQTLPFEYVFEVTSADDCEQAERLIEQFEIEKYRLKPIYTGENLRFFEENIFLTKEDILTTTMSIKDFFTRQAINIYDYGKINILPNGDAYGNVNHPALGNIYTHSIYEIVCKEIEKGLSWFRIRNEAPCNECVYQWLCPSPSDYETAIGRPDLCHVHNNKKDNYCNHQK